jgi:hypothetical protein
VNRPAGLRSRFTGTDGRGVARLQTSGARVVKCEDRDPDVVNDGVALVDDIRQSVSCVLVRDGGHCRVGIANDTLYGLGAGVWSRDGNTAYRAGRDIQAGRVWTNCYHAYPAHAAFGGYKQSGIGRENHKMMLDHYQQTKNLLVSYSDKAQGFF